MDNTPNDIFGKDNFYENEKKEVNKSNVSSNNDSIVIKGLMHNHTTYSIYDGAQSPLELVQTAKKLGYKNVCLSDHGTLMGLVPFLEACKSEDINGIAGVELYVTDKNYPEIKRGHLCIYAKDNIGLQSIIKILADSFNQYEKSGMITKKIYPITSLAILKNNVKKGHIIATTACVNGVAAQTLCGNRTYIKEYNKIQEQISNLNNENDFNVIQKMLDLEAKKNELKVRIDSIKKVPITPYKDKLKLIPKEKENLIKQINDYIEQLRIQNKQNSETKKELKNNLLLINAEIKEIKSQYKDAIKAKEKIEELQTKLNTIPFIPETERKNRTINLITDLITIFGKDNFFVELQNHGLQIEKEYYPQILNIAKEIGLKTVVANDAHYHIKEKSFKRWLLQTSGTITYYNMVSSPDPTDDEYYIKTEEELKNKLIEIFDIEDVNTAIANTYSVLSKCHIELNSKLHFPKISTTAEYDLRELTFKGAIKLYGNPLPDKVKSRLEYELDTINSMGFANYILIVRDYCNHAGDLMEERFGERIVSKGRGSAAGSCVCYCLGITGIDPLKYGLLFQRFLNPERVSMPDVDTDFPTCIRKEMFNYVEKKYGESHVTRISTISTNQTKGSLRTACSIVEHVLRENDKKNINTNLILSEKQLEKIKNSSYDRPLLKLGDFLSKAYDESLEEINAKIEKKKKSILASELLTSSLSTAYSKFGEELVSLIINYASELEGSFTVLGVHPAGCIISDKDVTTYAPVRTTEDKETGEVLKAIEADMIQAESNFGLIKMDFLGLITLDILAETLKQIRENTGKKIHIDDIPVDDEKIYKEIFSKGKTAGIFQFESDGMRNLLKSFNPNSFEDIVLLNACFRPGPLSFIPQITDVKKGKTKPHYFDKDLAPILDKTYGSPVYQEQIMQILQIIGSFTLGQADEIRRHMSKKHEKEFMAYKPQFIEGAIKKGDNKKEAEDFWDSLVSFSSYAFNLSHSAAYSLLAYQCAWLKYYFPKEFTCATFSFADTSSADLKMKEMLQNELKELGIDIITPEFSDIKENAQVLNENTITIGLANIKGIGRKGAESIIKLKDSMPEINLVNILSSGIPKDELIALAKVGVFDSFGIRRFEIINIINLIKDKYKENNNSLIGLINEKDEEIEQLYKDLSEESGLDINTVYHYKLAPEELKQQNTISDSVYNLRRKKIEEKKSEKYKLIKQREDLLNFINTTQLALKENSFKITLYDKQNEKDLTGIYLGKNPLEMANINVLSVIAKNYGYNLKLNPLTLSDKEEAIFPLLINGGFKKTSSNGNEYIGLQSEGQIYRSFNEDIVNKATEEGLTDKNIFAFYLVKLQKIKDYINITGILESIDISKNETITVVKNRNIANELIKEKIEPIKLYIENENKFFYTMGQLKEIEHIKVFL